jgi:Helix-hairpin-helix motif
VPLLTVGIGSPASFLYAAARRRSAFLGACAVGYGTALVTSFVAMAGNGTDAIGVLLFLVTWVVSTAHAMIARPRLYPPVNPRDHLNQQVVQVARHRRALREAARKIVEDDPGLAHELRIGRPDLLPRAFDDGGLIDVNHAPPQSLSLLPGLTYEMVDRIIRLRDDQGGFISVEELAVHADLPPAIVTGLAEYAIFIR